MPPYQVAGHQVEEDWVAEIDGERGEGVDIDTASKRKRNHAAAANRNSRNSGSPKKPKASAKPKPKMVSFVANERPAKVHTSTDKRQHRSMKQDMIKQMPNSSKEKRDRREKSEYAYGPPTNRSEQREGQKEPTFKVNGRLGRDGEDEVEAEVRNDGAREERLKSSSKSSSKQTRRDSPRSEETTKERKRSERAEEERAERRARREAEALEREREEREERRKTRRAERKRSVSPRRRPSPVRRNSNPLLHPIEFLKRYALWMCFEETVTDRICRSFSTTHIPIEHRHQPKRRHTGDDGRILRERPHEETAPIRIKVERREKPRPKAPKQSSTESSPKGEKAEKPVKL